MKLQNEYRIKPFVSEKNKIDKLNKNKMKRFI